MILPDTSSGFVRHVNFVLTWQSDVQKSKLGLWTQNHWIEINLLFWPLAIGNHLSIRKVPDRRHPDQESYWNDALLFQFKRKYCIYLNVLGEHRALAKRDVLPMHRLSCQSRDPMSYLAKYRKIICVKRSLMVLREESHFFPSSHHSEAPNLPISYSIYVLSCLWLVPPHG